MLSVAARLPDDDFSSPPDEADLIARAIDQYKRESGRLFPTWSEVLEVIRGLGYAKRERIG